jgi:hypothetical protein
MRAWFWTAVLVVLTAAVGVACGGGGGGDKAAPTPTPIDRATLETMLHSIAFKLEDLPAGFTVTSEVITNNEEAAATDPEGPTKAKERLDGWHRLLGQNSMYTFNDQYGAFVNGGLATIQANINIFGDEQGAADSIQWGRELFDDPARAATLTPGVSQMQGGPMSFPNVGDETIAAEFTGLFRAEEYNIDVPFTAHIVTVRQGKGVAYIVVSAIGGAKPGPEVEQMIRLLDERLAQTVH